MAGGRQEGSGKPETPQKKTLLIVLSGQIMLHYYPHRKHEALLSSASKIKMKVPKKKKEKC